MCMKWCKAIFTFIYKYLTINLYRFEIVCNILVIKTSHSSRLFLMVICIFHMEGEIHLLTYCDWVSHFYPCEVTAKHKAWGCILQVHSLSINLHRVFVLKCQAQVVCNCDKVENFNYLRSRIISLSLSVCTLNYSGICTKTMLFSIRAALCQCVVFAEYNQRSLWWSLVEP